MVPPATPGDLDQRIRQSSERFAAGEPAVMCIVEATDPDRFVGLIAWRIDLPRPFLTCDIGYTVHPDARRRGVARRAISTICRWLVVEEDGPHQVRVQLDHVVGIEATSRTANAAGFSHEGIHRAFFPLPDAQAPRGVRRHDVRLHGLVPDLA